MKSGHCTIYKFTVVIFLVMAGLVLNAQEISAATLTVTNTNDSGPGSLRQAIQDANTNAGSDTITFNIPTNCPQITPTSPLPPINAFVSSPVIINATSQGCSHGPADAPNVEISGQNAGIGARGLHFTGNGAGSSVRGLVINRFGAQGIWIDTNNITVAGNYIGTTADGIGDAGNGGDGIAIFSGTAVASANNNTIGGTTSADRNVISGNKANGVGITAQVGGNANNNSVLGNYIGTNYIGHTAIPNTGDGILINHADGGGPANSTGNVIGGITGTTPGGACTGACNLVSGNTANGIGLWHGGVSGTNIYGNYVGTNVSGTGALANGNIGVEVNEAPNNTVGGTTPVARNILSGNGGAGVFLTGAASTGNVVQGNYIGTNSAGTSGVGNIKMGIGIGFSPGAIGANSNTIGGTTGVTGGVAGETTTACTGTCNLISGNGQNGIFITGSESFGHQIMGNFIGTNAAGTIAIGNVSDGIGILNTPNTAIGNGTNNGRNFIASNGGNGITIAGTASTGNRIDNNVVGYIGFGNTASGIALSSATDTAILRNSIFYNGLLGIDLDNNGSTNLNDAGDSDGGANRLQNFPSIYAAKNTGGNTKIGGQFNGSPNGSYQIDFFYSNGCNGGPPRNYGQGAYYVGSTNINTDQFGNTAFGFTSGSPVPGNTYLTATATKKIGSVAAETSEFSKCVLVNAAKPALTNGATWFLKDYLIPGPADKTFAYGFPAYLLMCAWDANQPGVELPVIYTDGTWYMRASYTTGTADLTFSFGGNTYKPVCGDWNGDGVDTVGVVADVIHGPGGTWLLRNSNSPGAPDAGNFQFGFYQDFPIVGDWDGNGTDTVGRFYSGHFQLRNSNNSGSADYDFSFNPPNSKAVLSGDWDGNGTDTVGTVDTNNTWIMRNTNSSGPIDGSFQYGFSGATPLVW